MQVTGECIWKCVIGNLRRWRDGEVLSKQFIVNGERITLNLILDKREDKKVKFSWEPKYIKAAEWIEALGQVPLPPYLMREVVSKDKEDYQTIYAQHKGAVAAPTAGLHFTENTWAALDSANIKRTFLTLHVGAGTFLPVFEEDIQNHHMHVEQLFFNKSKVEEILNHQGPIIPVGTTSLRCLESLYWFGVQLITEPGTSRFFIDQELPYRQMDYLPNKKESIKAVLDFMDKHKIENIHGETGIFIYPGYSFKMCDALITNFHRPMSTLIMLIAGFMGDDWKLLYEEALRNNYRFLSYGDSSLIFPMAQ
jgi:S-adenosylmethionine:tRNA ribosyltransferase-isomerase